MYIPLIHKGFFTDYPFAELGDTPGKPAPMREVIPLEYDGNKYCKVVVGGIKSEVKAGYIYVKLGKKERISGFNPNYLESKNNA